MWKSWTVSVRTSYGLNGSRCADDVKDTSLCPAYRRYFSADAAAWGRRRRKPAHHSPLDGFPNTRGRSLAPSFRLSRRPVSSQFTFWPRVAIILRHSSINLYLCGIIPPLALADNLF